MKPLQHARITGRRYGGEWQDWIAIHDWIDRSKIPLDFERRFAQTLKKIKGQS